MSIYFITGNTNKLAEVQAIMPDVVQLAIDLPEIQELDAHQIIRAKLAAAFKHHSGEFIVEDTSLYLAGLNGLPGPLIKWFLQALSPTGVAKLAADAGNPGATAKTLIGYASSPDDIHFFEGAVEGEIVVPRGETTFGWDPIFVPQGYDKTFAEMARAEKNEISMRRRAVEQLKAYLST